MYSTNIDRISRLCEFANFNVNSVQFLRVFGNRDARSDLIYMWVKASLYEYVPRARDTYS